MKKDLALFFIAILSLFPAVVGLSQSLNDVNELLGKKDYKNAKVAIDAYMAQAQNNAKPDGWYYKGRVYNDLSKDVLSPESELYDLRSAAFEAFKKYQQLDPEDTRMKLENHFSYFDLYLHLYDLGAKLFQDQNYTGSFHSFKKALEVEDYILTKEYTYRPFAVLSALDTVLTLNTARAAAMAGKEEEAVYYYSKITDANVADPVFQEAYEYLVEYYHKKGDGEALREMLAKGKKYYPTNSYWNDTRWERNQH